MAPAGPAIAPGSSWVKKTSTLPGRDPPDRLGIIERQGEIGRRLLGLAVGQQLLDDEPRGADSWIDENGPAIPSRPERPSSRPLHSSRPEMARSTGDGAGCRMSEKRPDRGPGSAWCDTSRAYSPSLTAKSSS